MTRSSVAESAVRLESRSVYDYADLDEAFPSVDPGLIPFGTSILVQMRQPKSQTSGGIVLPSEVTQTDLWNNQVAKVIECGSAAFRNRDTLELWPEGQWCKAGDYVRVPKYGGDRWEVPIIENLSASRIRVVEKVTFVLFRDLDIGGLITCNPLSVIAFI